MTMKDPWLATLGLVVIVAAVVAFIAWALWPRKAKPVMLSQDFDADQRYRQQNQPPEKR